MKYLPIFGQYQLQIILLYLLSFTIIPYIITYRHEDILCRRYVFIELLFDEQYIRPNAGARFGECQVGHGDDCQDVAFLNYVTAGVFVGGVIEYAVREDDGCFTAGFKAAHDSLYKEVLGFLLVSEFYPSLFSIENHLVTFPLEGFTEVESLHALVPFLHLGLSEGWVGDDYIKHVLSNGGAVLVDHVGGAVSLV